MSLSRTLSIPTGNRDDRRLLDLVQPPGWVDPSPKDRYDLVVIGAGTGGLVCAAGAAGLGARVALVERSLMGGDCLNVGCVPSKALIAAAKGGGGFVAAMARMRRIRADLGAADSAARFTGLGVDVFLGHGRFTGNDAIEVNGRTLRFRRAVIATGGCPAIPSVAGLAEAAYLTNENVFDLAELPPRFLMIGAGPIGCELAQAFARFGSKVTLFDQAPRVLARDDPDAAALVQRALTADGVTFELGMRIERAERRNGATILHASRDGRSVAVAGDALLVAAGRTANVEHLSLEQAGVSFDRSGITVDGRLRTSNPRVYAVGDVCSAYPFTHSADAQARLVLANALFFGRRKHARLVIPWCTYTSPEVAHVGLTPDSAAKERIRIETIQVRFDDVDRAVLEDENEGFLKIHLRQGGDRIVGATIVHPMAGDLIGEAVGAMTSGLGLSALGRTIRPYPTRGDVYRKAADARNRGRLTPGVKRLLGFWFR